MHILIADDHAVVRRGLKEILEDAVSGAHFSEVGNGDQVLDAIARAGAQLLVLDINMPGRGGLDVLKDVKRLYPRLPVIVLSVQPEDQYGVRCLRAGASSYISKESAAEELAKAARKVLAGGRYVGPELAERLVRQLHEGSERPAHERLSDREHEVMLMIAAGKSLTEIAGDLRVSVKTISTYRARILNKLGIKSNAELVRYALANHLIG